MRVVIQRVTRASVETGGIISGTIGKGILVLLGIEVNDNSEDVEYLVKKIASLRIFNDSEGVMNLSLKEIQGEMLVVSQFTLHASTKKGNRPSYIRAARPEQAVPLYQEFLVKVQSEIGTAPQQGVFGAMMNVSLVNDGPVTIIIDSKNKE
jgi:D-tyrosyl-tRNA(Tyr) deacylase